MPGFPITPEEAVACYEWGQVRSRSAKEKGRKDAWGLRNDDPVVDARRQTVGMMGEYAIAKFFGMDPLLTHTVGIFKAPDLVVPGLGGVQAKASDRKYPELTIRPDAKNGEFYVLVKVTLSSPIAKFGAWTELLGWIDPEEARKMAKHDESLIRDPQGRNSPAIFLPPDLLHPMEMLRPSASAGGFQR